MPELKDIISQLRELNPKADEFANLLRESMQPLYQVVFDRGHGVATATAATQREKLEADLAASVAEVTRLTGKVKEYEEKTPDVAKLRADYDAELASLRTQLNQAKKDGVTKVKAVLRSRAQRDLVTELVALGVDRDYAEVQAAKPEHADRLHVRDDEGVDVLQAGKQVPIQSDKPLSTLAAEMLESIPPKWRTSTADNGAGSGAGDDAPTGNGTGAGGNGFFDGIRKSTADAEKAKAPTRSAAERMGAAPARQA